MLFLISYFLEINTFSSKATTLEELLPQNVIIHNMYFFIHNMNFSLLIIIHSFKYSVSWSGSEIPKIVIVESSKQFISFSKRCFTNWTFRKFIVIVVSSKKLWKICLTNSIVYFVQRIFHGGPMMWKWNWVSSIFLWSF